MADDGNPWELLLDGLERGAPVALLVVVASASSTPGKAGAKLAVAADGRLAGTIGGGSGEHQGVREARRLLRQHPRQSRIMRAIHRQDSDHGSGMICGGEQTVAIYPCSPQDLPVVRAVVTALGRQEGGLLRLSPGAMTFDRGEQLAGAACRFGYDANGDWRYEENLGQYETAYLIGGGHVSLALSRILATLDFRIVVCDSRPDLETLVNNPYAHEKVIVPFHAVGTCIPEGDRHYAVIMTPAHASDEIVLRQLIDKKLRYLSLLGSRTKVQTLRERLQGAIPPERLAHLRAPAGFPINSHSPAEIAVSIAAEMIAVRNGAYYALTLPPTPGGAVPRSRPISEQAQKI